MEVLLVDDQATTVEVYAASVRRTFTGARVHIAVDLPEALQIASGRVLDLVLLDLTLTRIKACLAAGARGYVAKTSAILSLPAAMRVITAGGRYVPPQAH